MYKKYTFKNDGNPKKFLTFSYDDGVTQDRRLITLMRNYDIRGTYNLNSGLFNTESTLPTPFEGRYVDHTKVSSSEIFDLYAGFEVAAHSLHHPKLTDLSDEELVHEVGDDALTLERLLGQKVIGMAYPGGPFFDDRVISVIKEKTDIFYARDITQTRSFEMPENLMIWHPTSYHLDSDIFDIAEKFINLEPEKDALFYIWGHSYELDVYDRAWENIEKLFDLLCHKEDIIYATNGEIAEYLISDKE